MKHTTKRLWLALAALAVIGLASEAKATYPNPTQVMDIRVSINCSKSLEVGTTWYNFGALPISSTAVSGSSVAVYNDSGGLVETYTLQASSAVPIGGSGTNWVLAASVGQDQYTLGAQFANGTGGDLGVWTTSLLTYSVVPCADSTFGNGTHAEAGDLVQPAATRYLWFRIQTPSSVSDTAYHLATVTLAVQ